MSGSNASKALWDQELPWHGQGHWEARPEGEPPAAFNLPVARPPAVPATRVESAVAESAVAESAAPAATAEIAAVERVTVERVAVERVTSDGAAPRSHKRTLTTATWWATAVGVVGLAVLAWPHGASDDGTVVNGVSQKLGSELEVPPAPSGSPSATASPSASPSASATPSASRAAGSPTAARHAKPPVAPPPVAPKTSHATSGAGGGTATPPSKPVVVAGTFRFDPGTWIRSGRASIGLLSNGNLVVVDENGVTRWSSGTASQGAVAVFQSDGNLVVYTSDWTPVWNSGTGGENGASLVLTPDGNVVIQYNGAVTWQAGTAH